MKDLPFWIDQAIAGIRAWEARWDAYEPHASLALEEDALRAALGRYVERMEGNYPFFHPRYAGQMLKPPHPAAIVGYVAAMLINPNNHALDGGPPTGRMEKELVRDLAALFHFPEETLGHLTSSGTIANLEALWVAREVHPDRAVAFSEAAHYTHSRMSQVLRTEAVVLPADARGRLRLDALEAALQAGRIGTVVATAGTTGLGAVDPIDDIERICREHGVRVHIDAAYGGFFSLLAWAGHPALSAKTKRHFQAVARCDSVVVDPHKHGLQPYGCGAVLFRDPSVGRFYKHDSPYTYFTSDELHLGEISLECSRAGAAAGALWFTLQVLPLEAEAGLGPVLTACLEAARQWHRLLDASDLVAPFLEPELDIVTFFPRTLPFAARAIDAASQRLLLEGMHATDDPVFLSTLRVESEALKARYPHFEIDQPHARILRSVLMKPEHTEYVGHLHQRVEALTASVQVGRGEASIR